MKAAAISVSDAMASPKLFAPFFSGSSWDTWRAVIKAIYAERMNVAELEAFRSVAERDPPAKSASEVVIVAGRGAGKDSIASLTATVTRCATAAQVGVDGVGDRSVRCCGLELRSGLEARSSARSVAGDVSQRC